MLWHYLILERKKKKTGKHLPVPAVVSMGKVLKAADIITLLHKQVFTQL